MEEFTPIINHPNYEISNQGNVRNTSTNKPLKIITMKNGCKKVNLYISPNNYYQVTIAKLVYQHFGNNYQPNKNIKHKDKNKLNCNIENLYQAEKKTRIRGEVIVNNQLIDNSTKDCLLYINKNN